MLKKPFVIVFYDVHDLININVQASHFLLFSYCLLEKLICMVICYVHLSVWLHMFIHHTFIWLHMITPHICLFDYIWLLHTFVCLITYVYTPHICFCNPCNFYHHHLVQMCIYIFFILIIHLKIFCVHAIIFII